MGTLWDKGLLPDDLEKHFYLTWFAFKNGNVVQLAKGAGIHRNTAITKFQQNWGPKFTHGFRRLWRKIKSSYSRKDLPEQIFQFYKKVGKRPAFSKFQSKGLVWLWLSGLPWKTLRTHYAIWAIRNGETRAEISKRLGISGRTFHRIRIQGAWKGGLAHKWLLPLRPKESEWYPGWARGRIRKKR